MSNKGGVITTGGGFSDYIAAPSWQSSQIKKYFQTASNDGETPVSGYSTTGRGYPDVSLLAASYEVIMDGSVELLYGTSASTPSFAGMISLVNAGRLANGMSSVGWINPSLYQYSSMFILADPNSGENNWCLNAAVCCSQGFYAVDGWDPVTGAFAVNLYLLAFMTKVE